MLMEAHTSQLGTFSTVYKAQDLTWDEGAFQADLLDPSKTLHGLKKQYVALKKIYVTSSPARILNELEILHDLRGHPAVCHIKAAFRLDDQVIAVLPYFPHTDFRLMFRTFLVEDMRHYFKSLLEGLAFVHKLGVIHRDIKPTFVPLVLPCQPVSIPELTVVHIGTSCIIQSFAVESWWILALQR